jgi:lipoic acid synthetase
MKIERKKPDWLKIRLPQGEISGNLQRIIKENDIHTICTSGMCPNRGECWSAGTATFMIGGNICTRACKFCNVTTGRPLLPDPEEPVKVARAVKSMGIRHVVLTSVDRDDLPDYGASHWVNVILMVKRENPPVTMETLIPDFQGKADLVKQIINARPEVISHNLETVERLTPQIRNKATYAVSLRVIRQIADSGIIAKSGIMLGLGESREEILQTMDHLRDAGCSVMTIGQYLQPTAANIAVSEYIPPECFEEYRQIGLDKGFSHVESAPLVRSSYRAEKHIHV